MRRNSLRRFFQQKQYAIASIVLFIAIAGMTGVYISSRITGENEAKQMELAEQESNLLEMEDDETELVNDEPVTSVTSVIPPEEKEPEKEQNQNTAANSENTDAERENAEEEKDSRTGEEKTGQPEENTASAEEEKETSAQTNAASVKELHFTPESDLGWPLQGDVILNYSMDQTVYFATLDQYKYNPALIIAGNVNDTVNAAATGRITSITSNEETGTTVTMELGDGYSAVYGQLKEVMYKEGALVEAGDAIGYIAEPTKYYTVEGSNLYFELLKDGEPVDPILFME